MAFSQKPMVVLVFLLAAFQVSMAAVYKVGGAAGWTTINPPDYTKWAASKTFHVGDTIVFEYNAKFHNVMQVSQADYNSCNAGAPIITKTSGNDSFTTKKAGHLYYLCGVPSHCQLGQKVDIKVLAAGASSANAAPTGEPAPAPAPAPGSPTDSSTTAPTSGSTNSATLLSSGIFGLVMAFGSAFAVFGF